MISEHLISWLLEGDVSIQYQTYRDLLNIEKQELRDKIAIEGWGKAYLSLRKSSGHWGNSFYQPKWTCSHYTLLELKNLSISPDNKDIRDTMQMIFRNNKCQDGGINPVGSIKQSDVCINGMVLNYAAYFGVEESDLESVVDFLLSQHMKDGGFNCHSNRKGATHSSLHTTLSVIEGILEYSRNGYQYRIEELKKAIVQCQEFILVHRLFRSDKTGYVIKPAFLKFHYPCRWYYDMLKALDHFQDARIAYDERMSDAIEYLLKRRNQSGQWLLQAKHPGSVHFEMETSGKPSRWNTLRALRVLKHFERL